MFLRQSASIKKRWSSVCSCKTTFRSCRTSMNKCCGADTCCGRLPPPNAKHCRQCNELRNRNQALEQAGHHTPGGLRPPGKAPHTDDFEAFAMEPLQAPQQRGMVCCWVICHEQARTPVTHQVLVNHKRVAHTRAAVSPGTLHTMMFQGTQGGREGPQGRDFGRPPSAPGTWRHPTRLGSLENRAPPRYACVRVSPWHRTTAV